MKMPMTKQLNEYPRIGKHVPRRFNYLRGSEILSSLILTAVLKKERWIQLHPILTWQDKLTNDRVTISIMQRSKFSCYLAEWAAAVKLHFTLLKKIRSFIKNFVRSRCLNNASIISINLWTEWRQIYAGWRPNAKLYLWNDLWSLRNYLSRSAWQLSQLPIENL